MLRDLAQVWLPGNGLYRGEIITQGTKGVGVLVRFVVSPDWSGLRWGEG